MKNLEGIKGGGLDYPLRKAVPDPFSSQEKACSSQTFVFSFALHCL